MLRYSFVFLLLVGLVTCQNVPYNVNKGRTPWIPMEGNFGDGNEYFIRDGMDGGKMTVSWDKDANQVEIHIIFNGLKTKTACYPRNPSNAYNSWPSCVHNGKWRFTIVHHVGTFPVEYYYDQESGLLLGNEYDYYGHDNLANWSNITVVNGTGTVMVMSEYARVANGRVDQVFRFRYDRFLSFSWYDWYSRWSSLDTLRQWYLLWSLQHVL
jgi:hypothetical protein